MVSRCTAPLVWLFPALAACSAGPPARPAGWWQEQVQAARPAGELDEGPALGEGNPGPSVTLSDTATFEVQWSRATYGFPGWAMHVRANGTASVISQEVWPDGAVLRASYRQLEFPLSTVELAALRQLVRDSGALLLQPVYGRGGEHTWNLGLRIGDHPRNSHLQGAFPAAARRLVQGTWDLLVAPRAESFAMAPLLEPRAVAQRPEYQPLR